MSDRTARSPGDSEPIRRAASRHLDRLLGDSDLLLRLQLSGFADDQWEPVAQEFARYGLGVMEPWIASGRVFAKVRERTGYRIAAPPDGIDDDGANELAVDTVVRSLRSFLDNVLKQGKWDPARGASLKTFFIGQCLLQFPNVYKRWTRERARWNPIVLEGDQDVLDRRAGTSEPADRPLLSRAGAAQALDTLTTDNARRAFALQDMGYTLDEIARELGLPDAKAVENLLGHQRRRAQRAPRTRRAQ